MQTNEISDNLIISYSFIDYFFNNEEARFINEISEKIKNKQKGLSFDKIKEERAIFSKFMSTLISNLASQEIDILSFVCFQNKGL